MMAKKKKYFAKTARGRKKEEFEDPLNLCRTAIFDTLSYRALFKYPLSFYQLSTYLVCEKKSKYEDFDRELKNLCKSKKLRITNGKYHLSGIRPISWDFRRESTKALFDKSLPALSLLKLVPWIKFVGITGTVAAYNALDSDDVDVFIISQKGRVWLTRFFVVLLLKAVGMYRTDDNPSGKICPNIFIDASKLAWPEDRRNLYVAHEIVMMRPVFDRQYTYFRFIGANSWVFDFFKNFVVHTEGLPTAKNKESRLINLLEEFLMKLQLRYMNKRRTTEVTSASMIHFNRGDNTDKFLRNYKEIRSQIKY